MLRGMSNVSNYEWYKIRVREYDTMRFIQELLFYGNTKSLELKRIDNINIYNSVSVYKKAPQEIDVLV